MSRPATFLLRSANASIRTFHSSIRACNVDLPPTPKSAEALGFKTQPGRQRNLPKDLDLKIKISDSGKKDILTSQDKGGKQYKNSNKPKININPKSQNSSINTVQEEPSSDFFDNSGLASSSSSSSGSSSKHGSRKDVQGISMDLLDQPSSSSTINSNVNSKKLPPDVLRRQRRENRSNNNNNNNNKGRQTQGRRDGSSRKVRDSVNVSSREKRVMLPKRQITFDKLDHSEQGLFGKGTLVTQSNTNASASNGLGHPRKTSSLRQITSTPAFPTTPIPVLSTIPSKSTDQAIQVASWTAALNGSIPLRFKDQLNQTVKSQLGR
ncbi:uncharacterized protein I206_104623 [Kwoniella pini CBS 10737]|uniref:Uncharacterized protein n=1 Tax=Kwoniella pini CBS 10737 TaxID=1296096 RepID=A0A1B9I7F5_9TREE|nr:uncharacterized protein I206_02158 [Kwoniella pini CBS 10737]OCF51444.1 hypothetical protein I206_02158 [Kwoniella pini CBS 10737]